MAERASCAVVTARSDSVVIALILQRPPGPRLAVLSMYYCCGQFVANKETGKGCHAQFSADQCAGPRCGGAARTIPSSRPTNHDGAVCFRRRCSILGRRKNGESISTIATSTVRRRQDLKREDRLHLTGPHSGTSGVSHPPMAPLHLSSDGVLGSRCSTCHQW